MTPGERIKQIRKSQGLSQKEFALRLGGESKTTVSGWESDRSLPKTIVLIEIAKMGNKTIDWLLTGKEAAEADEFFKSGFTVKNKLKQLEIEVEELKGENEQLRSSISQITSAAQAAGQILKKKKKKSISQD